MGDLEDPPVLSAPLGVKPRRPAACPQYLPKYGQPAADNGPVGEAQAVFDLRVWGTDTHLVLPMLSGRAGFPALSLATHDATRRKGLVLPIRGSVGIVLRKEGLVTDGKSRGRSVDA